MDTLHLVGITATDPADFDHFPPLAFGYLSSFLTTTLPQVRISLAPDWKQALDARPDIIGISATSVNFGLATRIARQIKARANIPIVVGGVHISLLPHTLPDCMDVGVVGEGELTAHDLLHCYTDKGRFEKADLHKVPGLCYHDGDRVRLSEKRIMIPDLDRLPHPDRSLAPSRGKRTHILASRGCPYSCAFCSSRAFWGSYRSFSAAYVLEEIDRVITHHGAREIHFYDDLFVADKKRLEQVVNGLKAKGLIGRATFSLAVRAELADSAVFDLLAEMGVGQVTFGAESNAPEILQYLKGESALPELNQRVVDLAHERGIGVSPSFIKGTPGESGDDLLATYSFLFSNLRRKKINYFEIHTLTPLPGTRVWDDFQKRGQVDQGMDWERLRTPWEDLYFNDHMPKASFYFFDTLTRRAQRMLAIYGRRLVAVVDVSGTTEGARVLGRHLERGRFFDAIHVIDFRASHTHIEGLSVEGPAALDAYSEKDEKPPLFCYCRPHLPIDPDALIRTVWHAVENGADLVVHGDWRHFTPATDFEKSIRVGNARAVRSLQKLLVGNTLPENLLDRLSAAGLSVAIYRPDLDPFARSSPVNRLFQGQLFADFKITKPGTAQEKRLAAVEQRIIEKSHLLPKQEARNRRWRNSRPARWFDTVRMGSIRRLFGWLGNRD